MELKKHFNLRKLFLVLYCAAFATYIIIGLQPASAQNHNIAGQLIIPRISLHTDVASLSLHDNKLDTPDEIAGAYSRESNKTMLIGHSTTVFSDLHLLSIGDTFRYNDKTYRITTIETLPKAEVSMRKLLKAADADTIILMTCAGELYDNGDASHRLIVTALVQ